MSSDTLTTCYCHQQLCFHNKLSVLYIYTRNKCTPTTAFVYIYDAFHLLKTAFPLNVQSKCSSLVVLVPFPHGFYDYCVMFGLFVMNVSLMVSTFWKTSPYLGHLSHICISFKYDFKFVTIVPFIPLHLPL